MLFTAQLRHKTDYEGIEKTVDDRETFKNTSITLLQRENKHLKMLNHRLQEMLFVNTCKGDKPCCSMSSDSGRPNSTVSDTLLPNCSDLAIPIPPVAHTLSLTTSSLWVNMFLFARIYPFFSLKIN